MLFSIIVPVYNAKNYLNKCIDSILNQTNTDFELILVDDGSTDGSDLICDEYAKTGAKVKVIHKQNGGATSARGAGLKLSCGEYVLFVDCDDYIESCLLSRIKEITEKFSCDLVCFGYDIFTNDSVKPCDIGYEEKLYNQEQIAEEIFPSLITDVSGKRFSPTIWGKAFKKDLLVPIHNDLPENIVLGEDSCVAYVAVYKSKSLFVLSDALYHYRVNNSSLTRCKKAFDWEEPLMRADFYLKHMPKEIFEEQVARITAHSFFNVAISVLKSTDYKNAKKEIKKHLSEFKVRQVIQKANFKNNLKEKLALYCLRKKKVFLMRIISKFI